MATDVNLAGLTLDYRKSKEEVYRDMTQYLIYNNPYTYTYYAKSALFRSPEVVLKYTRHFPFNFSRKK
jgi:hypothetical protein